MPSSIPLTDSHPVIAAGWHPKKNEKTAAEVSYGQYGKAWWCCSKGHEWQASARYLCHQYKTVDEACPRCTDRHKLLKNARPDLKAEWAPRNETPFERVRATSLRKFWWRCGRCSNEWQTTVATRCTSTHGCPKCAGVLRHRPGKSVAERRPDLAAEWHLDNTYQAAEVGLYSRVSVKWCCAHCSFVWSAAPGDRASAELARRSCPECVKALSEGGDRFAKASRLVPKPERPKKTYPERLVREWGPANPKPIGKMPGTLVQWQCAEGHVWEQTLKSRMANPDGDCPTCTKERLAPVWEPYAHCAALFAVEFPPRKAPDLRKRYGWKCSQGHHGEARLETWPSECRYCAKEARQAARLRAAERPLTDFAVKYPHLALEWSPKNDFGVEFLDASSLKAGVWTCRSCQHEWVASPKVRVHGSLRRGDQECPRCGPENLAVKWPALVAEWHPTRNDPLTPRDLLSGSSRKVWWQCGSGHEWEASPISRIGTSKKQPSHRHRGTVGTRNESGPYVRVCPECFTGWGWTVDNIRIFVRSILPYLSTFGPAELHLLLDQSGFTRGVRSRLIADGILRGTIALNELRRFADGEPSEVDPLTEDPDESGEGGGSEPPLEEPEGEPSSPAEEPAPEATEVLNASNRIADFVRLNEAATRELTQLALSKLWRHAFADEAAALSQARAFNGDAYANTLRDAFLAEHASVVSMPLPQGYAFQVNGVLTNPNLMQRLTAHRLAGRRQYGNWSGTGAGKTLSAVLASRVVESPTTLILCPNNVIDTWVACIRNAFPTAEVRSKDWTPCWASDGPRYIILNYEMLQVPEGGAFLTDLIETQGVAMAVVDEAQLVKQRYENATSFRRASLLTALQEHRARNPKFYLLLTSATPTINNLFEVRSLIELLTGAQGTQPLNHTVVNCLSYHRQLLANGLRWKPDHSIGCEEIIVEAPCNHILPELVRMARGPSTPLRVEQILTQARLPAILQHIVPKTLIYTHNITEIVPRLQEVLGLAGHNVGIFTGEDKSGLEAFLHGDTDVLIASSAILLGIDGLQHVCNRLIVNVLPWTSAEYEHLKGRIHRQNQLRPVTVILPITSASVRGNRWSWCETKLTRIRFKRTIGDAVSDGIIPQAPLRTPNEALQDAMAWLNLLEPADVERLATG